MVASEGEATDDPPVGHLFFFVPDPPMSINVFMESRVTKDANKNTPQKLESDLEKLESEDVIGHIRSLKREVQSTARHMDDMNQRLEDMRGVMDMSRIHMHRVKFDSAFFKEVQDQFFKFEAGYISALNILQTQVDMTARLQERYMEAINRL
jgi:hypothetical protein